MLGIDQEDVKSVATEMGVRYVLLNRIGVPPNADPDTLFFYESPIPIHFSQPEYRGGPYDAVLFYGGATCPIIWSQNSKASIRILLEGGRRECAVCFEEGAIRLSYCPQCHCRVCTVCTMKMALSPEYISQLRDWTQMPPVTTECPQCRVELTKEAMHNYCTVMDRLDEFNEEQQKLLKWFKSVDPEYEITAANWNTTADRLKYIQKRSFRKGCRVKLRGLKTQKKWNGKKAVIIGTKMIKNNTIRWPIELMVGRSKTKALMKPCNMKKI